MGEDKARHSLGRFEEKRRDRTLGVKVDAETFHGRYEPREVQDLPNGEPCHFNYLAVWKPFHKAEPRPSQ